jgi:hypothetical protein
MRYLNKREDFLKQKKHIKGVPYETLLEVTSSAGPFANDVGWNDSLLGRLINHAIRKARIAAKVPTIKRLIDRLKIEFDQIVGQSTVFSLEEEDQILKIRIEISEFFKKLIEAVEVRTADTIYLVKVSTKLASRMEKYDEEDAIKRHNREPVAYKIKQNEIKFILDEIKKNKTTEGGPIFYRCENIPNTWQGGFCCKAD